MAPGINAWGVWSFLAGKSLSKKWARRMPAAGKGFAGAVCPRQRAADPRVFTCLGDTPTIRYVLL